MSKDTELSRRSFLKRTGAGALAASALGAGQASSGATRPNVLFICVDDLRPQLNCYGHNFMHTPVLDQFANDGLVFNRHYVQVPTCGASRCSMLTSHRPDNRALLGNGAFRTLPRTDVGPPISLPHHFRDNGYTTVSVGKVTHLPNGRRYPKPAGRFDDDGNMIYSGPDDREPELAMSWDRVYGPIGEWGDPWSAFFAYAGGETRSYRDPKSPATEAADVDDTGYPDGITAQMAVDELHKLKDEPFFLSVGFYKPHLPFCAPKKYWDLYDRETIPLAEHRAPPANVDPKLSLHRNGELTGRYDALDDPAEATPEEARRLRHGYFACTSYIDAQIGKVLDTLDELGLRDNTIVVVWGDHGWHLGDLHVWGKHTTFEFSLQSALLMRGPGVPQRQTTDAIVESLDLYPTLADACGLEVPEDLHGASMTPLFNDPLRKIKDSARGYWKRGSHQAETMRTDRYRLTVWRDGKGDVVQTELYDHDVDREESVNLAPERPEVVARLMTQIRSLPQLVS